MNDDAPQSNSDANMASNQSTTTKCGFVALLGAPNAGKSTLINTLTGTKLAIVSHRPGTTRTRMIGICTHDESQIIFVDLPGIFAPKGKMQKIMVDTAWEEANTADCVFVLVDASRKTIAPETQTILDWLKEHKHPAVLILNKVDLIDKPKLLPLAQQLTMDNLFSHVLMISASTGDGIDKVLQAAEAMLPHGPWQYPADQLTDLPERIWAAEITREQVFLQLEQELPYATVVETEFWQEKGKRLIVINQVIYIDRESQKAIVLGKAGARIKQIGTAARIEMEKELECKVHLTLHVKVKNKWAEDPHFLREQGLLGDKI